MGYQAISVFTLLAQVIIKLFCFPYVLIIPYWRANVNTIY
jgi:hypothetical protein